jgi:gluconate 2-dehydrogenase gamma chain
MAERVVGRRVALKYFGILAASAAGRDFLTGWMGSARAATGPGAAVGAHVGQGASSPAGESAEAYVPRFFKPQEFETVGLLTELIIPTDDKPGAREAKVAHYIDFVVYSAAEFRPSLQKEWTDGLAWLDRVSREKFGGDFRSASPANQESLLMEMSLPERDASAHHPGYDFCRLVKEMTVEGFYTSRVGLIDVLEYQGLTYLPEFPGCTHPEHQA